MFNSFFTKIKDYTRQISEIESSVDKEKQNFLEIYERNLILEKEIQDRTLELGQANKSILALSNILNTINSSSPLEEVLKRIANGVCSDLGYVYSLIFRVCENENGKTLRIRAISDNKLTAEIETILGKPFELLEIPLEEKRNPITKYIYEDYLEKIKKFDSIFEHSNFEIDNEQKNALAELFKKFSILTLPIHKDQSLFGSLVVVSPRADILETEKNFLMLFARQIEVGVTIADLFETIKKQAVTDALTGLYNRRHFDFCLMKEAERSLRQAQPFSLITLDLDHLKYINDTFGHALGDVAIATIAKVLKEKARAIDMTARFGGEEFGVILPGVDSKSAMLAAERIRAAIEAEPIPQVKKITASVGVVTFGEHTENIDELLEMADKAMYDAKKTGRNRVKLALKEDKESWLDIALETFLEIIENNKKINLDKRLLNSLKRISTHEKRASDKIFSIVDSIVKNYDPMQSEGTTKQKVALAVKLAQEIQLDFEEIEKIKLAVLLYDLGNLLLPDDILLKPGPLNEQEKKLIWEHPTMAVKQILKPTKKVDEILPMIQSHHERWDGLGYPQKLSGESIPIGARIIVIVDAYFALISDRSYRLAYTKKDALKVLISGANTQWDGRLVEIFVQIIQRDL